VYRRKEEDIATAGVEHHLWLQDSEGERLTVAVIGVSAARRTPVSAVETLDGLLNDRVPMTTMRLWRR